MHAVRIPASKASGNLLKKIVVGWLGAVVLLQSGDLEAVIAQGAAMLASLAGGRRVDSRLIERNQQGACSKKNEKGRR